MMNPAQFSKTQSQQTKRHFLYARKSQESEERQQLSIPGQVEELTQFARKENIRLADILTESKTAKEPGRPIFNEMLERIEAGEAQGILAWHPDRLARNAVDAGKIIHLLDTGKLTSLKFPTFWFQNTPQGLFMISIAFGQAKYYSDNLSENTKRGMRQKARMGIFPGWAPRGYFNDKNTKSIVVDPQTAKPIKKMFELYATGDYTCLQCARFLAEHRIYSRFKNGKLLREDRIKYVLQNPFYYGCFIFKGALYEGVHEPIISKKLFDEVQRVLMERCHNVPQEPHRLPFAGFIHCGECGFMITGERHTKYYKRRACTATYIYYRCTKKSKTHRCQQLYVNQEKLIPQINNLIQKVSLSESEGQYFFERISQEEKEVSKERRAARSKVEKQLAEVNLKLERLLDTYLDQVIDRQSYAKKQNQLMGAKKTLMEKSATFDRAPNDWLEPFREWVKSALEAEKIAKDGTNLFAKRSFLQNAGSNLKLKDEQLRWDKAPFSNNAFNILFLSNSKWQKRRAVHLDCPPTRNLVAPRRVELRFLG